MSQQHQLQKDHQAFLARMQETNHAFLAQLSESQRETQQSLASLGRWCTILAAAIGFAGAVAGAAVAVFLGA